MPTEIKHQKQYENNKKMLSSNFFDLNSTNYYDWAVTIAFYCALHLIEKFFSSNPALSHDMKHYERNKLVPITNSLKDIADEYQALYSESIRARYNCEKITRDDASFVINTLLKRIEDKLA